MNVHSTSVVFSHNLARKKNKFCLFSHDQVTYDITASSNYKSAIWADTDIYVL